MIIKNEIRYDPIKKQWIIIAAHRKERPVHPDKFCPFCPGSPEIPDTNWDVLILPNRFPSLRLDATPVTEGDNILYRRTQAKGVCEVVIYTPYHNIPFEKLPNNQIKKIVELWQERYRVLGNNPEVKYVFIFENKGREIGVTLDHPHGQIYAFSQIPSLIKTELTSAEEYFQKTKTCIFCDIIEQEIIKKERIVYENEHFIAFIPFWAMFPFEVYMFPKRHILSITDLNKFEIESFVDILKTIRLKYNTYFGFDLPLMMYFHQIPTDGKDYSYYHFHVEFRPIHRAKDKIKYPAGVEHGTGTFINPSDPEKNAKLLRETKI